MALEIINHEKKEHHWDIGLDLPIDPKLLNITQEEIKESIVALLYHKNALTLKQAREVIGKSRRQFEEDILPKYGYPMYGNTPEDIETEIKASKR